MPGLDTVARILNEQHDALLSDWLGGLAGRGGMSGAPRQDGTLREQAARLLSALAAGLSHAPARAAGIELEAAAFGDLRDVLEDISRGRALAGASPAETAVLVFALKEPLFSRLREAAGSDTSAFADALWDTTRLVDRLGLYTMEAFQKSREQVIARQQQELLELSTPVVELWTGILALPLIGTLDSARTQIVMESLLQKIVETGAPIAIIDITGVPMVDTLVAQHLLKTVAAARLMGADCIISGIRPQIAQTIVHLGVDLSTVTTKATLADAFAIALRRSGQDAAVRAEAARTA